MRKNFLKKIISSLLILSFVVPSTFLTFPPKKVEAQWATFDAATFGQSFVTAANSITTSYSSMSLQLKAFVLDTLATALAKQLIRRITADVVNWINGGFEGSPAFITNPGEFFLDVADQVTGEFLAKSGGPLNALCSPFSIDIRLALAFKYHPKIYQKYSCTLGAIISNTKTAAENATINGRSISGFMNGDFSQGGLPAFVSLTTEPQNNPYGAYLEANSELGIRVANAQKQQKDELNQGKGFLSWKKCTRYASEASPSAGSPETTTIVDTESGTSYTPAAGGTGGADTEKSDGSNGGKGKCLNYETQTPGSLIVSSLETSANGPLHELELVDSINEVVNALAAQMINTILQGGLRALSGTGPSDSTSYLNQVQAEAQAGTPAVVNSTKNEFINSVETYITNTLQYKNNKDQSLNLILEVKNGYDAARTCYAVKIASSMPPLSASGKAYAESKMMEIDNAENGEISSLATNLLIDAREADSRYTTLTTLRADANAAKTLNDINGPSQKFNQMLQNRSLVTGKEILESQQQLDSVRTKVAPLKVDAERKLQECQLFSPSSFGR